MKKIIILLLVLVVVILLYFAQSPKNTSNSIVNTPTVEPSISTNLPSSIGSYSYFISSIANPEKITLIENTNNDSFNMLVENNQCNVAINGGYYTSELKPLGLFIVNGSEKYPAHQSNILNGYFYIDTAKANIASLEPQNAQLALQAGPVLIYNANTLPVLVTPDKKSRRSIVALTDQNEVLFIVIQGKENTFEGPFLSELPTLLQEIANKEHVSITSAMNLDGGSSSAFFSQRYTRSESERVGSILCETS